jgi:hypothetical protein
MHNKLSSRKALRSLYCLYRVITIRELAMTVKKVVGYNGDVDFDVTKPDGTPRKLLDCSKLHAMGWRHTIELEEGIKLAYWPRICADGHGSRKNEINFIWVVIELYPWKSVKIRGKIVFQDGHNEI